MSDGEVEITFECLSCGGTILSLPDDYTDDSIASCKACGQEFGRFGDVKAKAVQELSDRVRKQFRDSFKGLKGWKLS